MDHSQLGTRPTRDGFQAVRSKLGLPSLVIWLSTRTPIQAFVFWFANLRAFSPIHATSPSGIKFEQFEIQLNKGDRILIFSDGVTECPGPNGEMFEEKGLEELMCDLRHVKGQEFFDALIWNLTSFAENDEFPDDVSGILFEFNG